MLGCLQFVGTSVTVFTLLVPQSVCTLPVTQQRRRIAGILQVPPQTGGKFITPRTLSTVLHLASATLQLTIRMEDPITADDPTRGGDEAEEREAQAYAAALLQQPIFMVRCRAHRPNTPHGITLNPSRNLSGVSVTEVTPVAPRSAGPSQSGHTVCGMYAPCSARAQRGRVLAVRRCGPAS